MLIVDTHCHATPIWYEPVESLIYQMDQNGVDKAVLVQIQGYFDNEYQFEAEKRYPGRLISVVIVDTRRADAPQQLEQLVRRGARGVRLLADARSPGGDPLTIWRKADELGLPVSCAGTREQFASDDFVQVIESLPTLPIIIEHLGSIKAWDAPSTYPSRERIFSLARYSNVYMKIHGLGEFCTRNLPVTSPFPYDPAGLPLLHRAYDAFGPERLMWGSDYPPVSQREGYANALRFTLAEFESKPEAERALIFGGVAAKLYGLD